MDFPVLSGMFAGILDQVPESLGKPFLIAADDSFPFYGQGCVRPQGMHLFPVFFDHLPDIAFLKSKFISVGAQFFQPQEAADQRLHTLDLGDLLLAVSAFIHLAVQAQGSQWRLQLVGDVRRQVAGPSRLLPETILCRLNAVLHLQGSVLHLCDLVFLQGQRQISAVSRQVILHFLRKPVQPFHVKIPADQDSSQDQQEDSAEDVSNH